METILEQLAFSQGDHVNRIISPFGQFLEKLITTEYHDVVRI